MRYLLLLTAAAFMGSVGAAAAADPVTRAAPRLVAAPAFTWTGFYVGAHAGYLWSDSDMKLVDAGGLFMPTDVANGTLPRKVSLDHEGALGGFQAGYNMQFGMFVAGVEADFSWTDAESNEIYSAPDLLLFPGAITNTVVRSELQSLGTLRGRFGVAVDRALFFVTSGVAAGDIKNTYSINIPAVGYVSPTWSKSDTEWGWTIGAGIEYALTNNITVKAEYLYYDLDNQTIRGTDPNVPLFAAEFIDYKFKNDGNVARAGVNVRF